MKKRVLERVEESIRRVTPTGACLIEGCGTGSSFGGLCAAHYTEAVEARMPEPVRIAVPGRCAVRGHTSQPSNGTPYCKEHEAYFESMRGGALLRRVEKESRYPVSELPLGEVHPGTFAMRPDVTPESVADLAKSMAKDGQLAPILVVPDRKGYEIVFGHRRWLAATQIPGKRTILAQVAPSETPRAQFLALASAENFERQWVPPFGKSAWMAKLRDREGLTNEEIAAAMNLSVRSVEHHFSALANTHPDVLDAYLSGRIPLGTAVRLGRVKPERQPELLATAMRDSEAGEKEAVRAVRAQVRAAYSAWRDDPGEGVSIRGGRKGPVTVCLTFEGQGDLFEFYRRWVHPRRK